MYCVNGASCSSLLIESTDSMIVHAVFHPEVFARGGHNGLFKILGGRRVVWACEVKIPTSFAYLISAEVVHTHVQCSTEFVTVE